jgi:hypothetical protein
MPTWSPYIIDRHRDDLGRWCSVTLQGKANRQIVFYSFHNCCKNKIEDAGIHTIYSQKWHGLPQRGDSDPDPRIQAVQDPSAELLVHQTHHRSLCIMGDFNEDPGLTLL